MNKMETKKNKQTNKQIVIFKQMPCAFNPGLLREQEEIHGLAGTTIL